MVYDCFAFFNELDLLEIRLNELNDVVDKFVLVEATRTFQKKPKPFYFEENKQRYEAFLDKIIHVKVDKYPSFFKKFRVPHTWDYDNHQKEQILKGLTNAKPEDTIIISDLDEIPNPSKVLEFKDKPGFKVFELRLYFYYLNGLCVFLDTQNEEITKKSNRDGLGFTNGTVMMSYGDFLKKIKTVKKARILKGFGISDSKYFRNLNETEVITIQDSGWHFSYLGGVEKVIEKIESWTHDEYNNDYYKNPERIKEIIKKGEYLYDTDTKFEFVQIDETFPKYLQSNQEKYKDLILEN